MLECNFFFFSTWTQSRIIILLDLERAARMRSVRHKWVIIEKKWQKTKTRVISYVLRIMAVIARVYIAVFYYHAKLHVYTMMLYNKIISYYNTHVLHVYQCFSNCRRPFEYYSEVGAWNEFVGIIIFYLFSNAFMDKKKKFYSYIKIKYSPWYAG